jgi:hypothetical protein
MAIKMQITEAFAEERRGEGEGRQIKNSINFILFAGNLLFLHIF